MRIKRREILKAIRTEKLQGGSFIDSRYENEVCTWVHDDKCKVCAVGAVLRFKGVASEHIEADASYATITGSFDGISSAYDEFEALREKAYLNALSIRFERLSEKQGSGKKTKEALARFVKRHFPKEIKVDLG